MDLKKLFQVLVVTGVTLGAASCGGKDNSQSQSTDGGTDGGTTGGGGHGTW
jgi:hypothetical protein